MIAPFLDLLFLKNEQEYIQKLSGGAPEFKLTMNSLIENFYYFLTNQIVIHGKEKTLLLICVLVVIMFFLKNFFKYMAMFFLSPIRNHVVKDLRQLVFDKIVRLPVSYYTEEKKGDIMARVTSDVHEIEWSIMASLEIVFRDPVAVVMYLTALIFMSPQLTLFVFVLLPFAGLLIAQIGKSLKKTTSKSRSQFGELTSLLEETIGGLRIIKAFNAEKKTTENFRFLNLDYTKTMIRMYRKIDLSSPLSEFLGTIVLVIVMYFGGKLVLQNDGSITASLFITYVAVFSQIIPPSRAISTAYSNIQRGLAAAERLFQILDADNKINDAVDAKNISSLEKEIKIENLSFEYTRGDSGYVLKNINLTIPKGMSVALVGQSGSGKSTLADLICRFYEVDHGGISIDGINIKQIKTDSLRNILGIVNQDAILFNDTIANNIRFGNPHASLEEIINAAKIANAHEFIMQIPNGYDAIIGDRGSKLSGGQKQRLSIARAVLKNPQILILDEATSALDNESEKLVQNALEILMKGRTSIIIAHRLSTIIKADIIVVLNKGEIVEQGNHEHLMSYDSYYKKLFEMQK